ELLDGPAFAVQERFLLFEADEARHDDPAFALPFLFLLFHLGPGVFEPEQGDVEHALVGLVAEGILGKFLHQPGVGVGGARQFVLFIKRLGLVELGFLDKLGRVLLVIADPVEDALGPGIIFLAVQLVTAGQRRLRGALGGFLLGRQAIGPEDEAFLRRRRRL